MISALQRKKFSHRFTTLDVNRSGYLELSDYATVATKMCGACGVSAASGIGLSLVRSYRDAFEGLARNRGAVSEVRITREEFIHFITVKLAGRPEVFERGMRRIAELVADVCDANHDGHLDENDLIRFLGSYSIREAEFAGTLRRLGVDSNGSLSREKFIEYSREFYCGDNPSSPGNWLFGEFERVCFRDENIR